MSDLHPQLALKLGAPYLHAKVVTPHDVTDLTHPVSALAIGTAGSTGIKVITKGGETITIASAVLTANPLLPLQVTRVYSTGTDATNIVALW